MRIEFHILTICFDLRAPYSLQLLLLEAERAWTYSRELNAQSTSPANKERSAGLRRNATSRFRRATNWATQLLSHCQSLFSTNRLSAESLVQATVYTLILNGRFLSNRFDYDSALVQLCVARTLLDELAARAATSRDQALATAFADEIGPEIRYCAHELGNTKAYDVDAIVSEIASKHKNEIVDGYDNLVRKLTEETAGGAEAERKKLKPVLWEGEPIPIRNPELVDVLLKVQEAEAKLQETPAEKQSAESRSPSGKKGKVGKGTRSKRGVAAYDAILLALSDAEEVARKLVETQQVSYSGSYAFFSIVINPSNLAVERRHIDKRSRYSGYSFCACLHCLPIIGPTYPARPPFDLNTPPSVSIDQPSPAQQIR